jgi:hypothetical protein
MISVIFECIDLDKDSVAIDIPDTLSEENDDIDFFFIPPSPVRKQPKLEIEKKYNEKYRITLKHVLKGKGYIKLNTSMFKGDGWIEMESEKVYVVGWLKTVMD